ncbi:MAG: hypothetical protein ACR2KT_18985 [Methylocella sp.]
MREPLAKVVEAAALTYNLGNFLRILPTPDRFESSRFRPGGIRPPCGKQDWRKGALAPA